MLRKLRDADAISVSDDPLMNDDVWAFIRPHVEEWKARRTIRNVDDRTTLEGILWAVYYNRSWRDVPEHYGKWDTVFRLFKRLNSERRWHSIYDSFRHSGKGGFKVKLRSAPGGELNRLTYWHSGHDPITRFAALLILVLDRAGPGLGRWVSHLARESLVGLDGPEGKVVLIGEEQGTLAAERASLEKLLHSLEEKKKAEVSHDLAALITTMEVRLGRYEVLLDELLSENKALNRTLKKLGLSAEKTSGSTRK